MKKKLFIIGCLLLTTATFSIVKKDPAGRVLIYSKQPTQGVTIYTNDSVGIGTNSPSAKLQITGNAEAQPILKIGSNVANGNLLEARGNLSGNYAMLISTSGNVGIGTDNVSERLVVEGTIKMTKGAGIVFADGSSIQNKQMHTGAVYRWNVFTTYRDGWVDGNSSYLFGGIAPSTWSSAYANQLSSDKNVLRRLFINKGYGGKSALVVSDDYYFYPNSTGGRIAVALFRIKNITGSPIDWTVNFKYSSGNWASTASAACNGVSEFTYSGNQRAGDTNVVITIPANRTSTVIFQSSGYYSTTYAFWIFMAFGNDSLALPAGLEYVDDFDTATGGWEQ